MGKKKNAAANKLKYPKGAAQVVGVKEYLEDLAKKQTFFRDAAGNSRVGDTSHKWAKVKFGEFTKGLRRVARQGRQEAAEPDVLSARCARRPLTYDLSNI